MKKTLAATAIAASLAAIAPTAQAQWAVVCPTCSQAASQALEYGSMVKDTAVQAAQYATQVSQYTTMVRNLVRLDPATIGKIIGVPGADAQGIVVALKDAYTASTSLYQSANRVYGDWLAVQRVADMSNGKFTHAQIIDTMKRLAVERGGVYEQQMKQREANQKAFENSQKAVAAAADNINLSQTQMQGLQQLSQQASLAHQLQLQMLAEVQTQGQNQSAQLLEKAKRDELEAAARQAFLDAQADAKRR